MKKVTPRTLPLVWLKLSAYVAEALKHPEAAAAMCDDLNTMLDSILEQDGFGTEGQNDPRGDHRS